MKQIERKIESGRCRLQWRLLVEGMVGTNEKPEPTRSKVTTKVSTLTPTIQTLLSYFTFI